MKIGDRDLTNLMRGDTPINRVMRGDTLIWERIEFYPYNTASYTNNVLEFEETQPTDAVFSSNYCAGGSHYVMIADDTSSSAKFITYEMGTNYTANSIIESSREADTAEATNQMFGCGADSLGTVFFSLADDGSMKQYGSTGWGSGIELDRSINTGSNNPIDLIVADDGMTALILDDTGIIYEKQTTTAFNFSDTDTYIYNFSNEPFAIPYGVFNGAFSLHYVENGSGLVIIAQSGTYVFAFYLKLTTPWRLSGGIQGYTEINQLNGIFANSKRAIPSNATTSTMNDRVLFCTVASDRIQVSSEVPRYE